MNKQFFIRVCLLTSLVAMAGLSIPAQSATVAYWRFDAGPANTNVLRIGSAGYTYSAATPDASGNGNHLAVWSTGGGAGYAYRSTVGVTTLPQTGQANPFCVQNTGGSPAMFTRSSQSFPAGVDIEGADTFKQFTIEAYFKPEASTTAHRTLVGRDARNVSTAVGDRAALYFKVEPNNTVSVSFADAAGFWHSAGSTVAVQGFPYSTDPTGATGRWYYMAAVSDGKTLSLYLANVTAGTPLQLVAQTDIAVSGSPNTTLAKGTTNGGDWHAGGWSVGRGLWAGGHADRAWGFLDEVRISNHAVAPAHFLYSSRVNAWNPTPADSAFGVGTPVGSQVNVDLSWNTGMRAADLTQVNPAIGKHYLYMSADQRTSSDPNLNYVKEIAAAGATGQTALTGLNFDGRYLWRIDESVSGSLPSEPNTIKGPMWTFNTRLSVPVITLQPVNQLVDAGQTVVFTIAVDSISSVGYKWYKSVDNATNTSDDDVLVGTSLATQIGRASCRERV